MARKPRGPSAAGIYHLYARGVDRGEIFRSDSDRILYLELLGAVASIHRWRCLAYCLMGNHVHLLVETPKGNLSAGMRRLQGDYAQKFNWRHGRSGHLFQGRFGSVQVESDIQLSATVSYVAHNPVEAGFCERPEEWRWSSSYSAVAEQPPGWLDLDRLRALGGDSGTRLALKG